MAEKKKAGKQPVEINTENIGCGRWVPNDGACALLVGHDGECLPIGRR